MLESEPTEFLSTLLNVLPPYEATGTMLCGGGAGGANSENFNDEHAVTKVI